MCSPTTLSVAAISATASTAHRPNDADALCSPSSASITITSSVLSIPTNCSAPQCCHCGWRGSHAPNCPFK
ncbi:hypothetical protein BDN71DRAFT_1447278 [Pleurotus eryngii]|uniref:Uncharacterized protein n=1 Tax=Pleurotus eryngii TaxID=5323 RepID=A0A9P5ZYT7_PLEER|nr:hypothetical protein BDN71DRAFT_1447278 [Pleurotus eryngii]